MTGRAKFENEILGEKRISDKPSGDEAGVELVYIIGIFDVMKKRQSGLGGLPWLVQACRENHGENKLLF